MERLSPAEVRILGCACLQSQELPGIQWLDLTSEGEEGTLMWHLQTAHCPRVLTLGSLTSTSPARLWALGRRAPPA